MNRRKSVIVVVSWLKTNPQSTSCPQSYSKQWIDFLFSRNGCESVTSEDRGDDRLHLDDREFVADAISGTGREGQKRVRVPLL